MLQSGETDDLQKRSRVLIRSRKEITDHNKLQKRTSNRAEKQT
jgi:hypothetical protein